MMAFGVPDFPIVAQAVPVQAGRADAWALATQPIAEQRRLQALAAARPRFQTASFSLLINT